MRRPQVYTVVALALVLFLSSCIAKRKYIESQSSLAQLRSQYSSDSARNANRDAMQGQNIGTLERRNSRLQQQLDSLNRMSAGQQGQLGQLGQQLGQQQERLGQAQKRIENLQALIDQQRKTTNELRQKISDALTKFSSSELSVSSKNGKVYVSLSENLLFPSGSASVNKKGIEALGKLAEVLNSNPDININIEGHTDSIPIRGKYEDNWALSVARATSIVRILTKTYMVDPVRIIASGHSQFDPVDSNSSTEGRAKNRRTEIILIPKLDELYQLIEQGG